MLTLHQSPAQAKNEQRITSLEMAEITQTLHKNLLQSVRNQEVSWSQVTGLKFQLSEYSDASGRKLPMYEFNQAESLYIASKFNDEVRAKLVVRWMQLEQENSKLKRRLKLRDDERLTLELIAKQLIPGDQKSIANKLGVARRTVSAVKCGRTRSARIMAALVDQAVYNKQHDRQLVIGYSPDFLNLAIRKLEGGTDV